jgi:hypothetical protein
MKNMNMASVQEIDAVEMQQIEGGNGLTSVVEGVVAVASTLGMAAVYGVIQVLNAVGNSRT